jgi:hypothetical protein
MGTPVLSHSPKLVHGGWVLMRGQGSNQWREAEITGMRREGEPRRVAHLASNGQGMDLKNLFFALPDLFCSLV